MPSIIPDFEYDIFISYRHNDNLDGWVTDFVQNLQKELKATIKEPLSSYFDKNPHDGILETHNVDKSLEGKLKCLIFIPILSQTYCDPKSFAWQHEFCAFNKLAQEDPFGRDLKLSNGNVASRILAIKIHDLDEEDKTTIETEIGGALRVIEFIFKTPGVNRPLRALEEHPNDNVNKIFYRDQINKVANAIKEIVQSAKSASKGKSNPVHKPTEEVRASRRAFPLRLLVLIGILICAAVGYWKFKPELQSINRNDVEDKSLVVLPFADLSPKKDQEWFSDGLTEELLNNLSSLSDLKLISRTTSFSFKDKGMAAKAIADSIKVSHVLEGSVRKVNDQLKVTVQLIRAADDAHMWSHVYDYKMDSIFKIQEDISKNVARILNLLLDAQTRERMFSTGTHSVDAYEEYLKGNSIYYKAHVEGDLELLSDANKHFEKAIRIDPQYADAYYRQADIHIHNLVGGENVKSLKGLSDQAKYDSMMSDINSALRFTKSPSKRLSYGFASQYFSKDWSRLPSYIQLKESWDSGWEVVLALRDPEFVYQHYAEMIGKDPYAEIARAFAASALVFLRQYDSAILMVDNRYSTSRLKRIMKSAILLQKGDYANALDAFETPSKDVSSMSLLLKLLNGTYKNKTLVKRDIKSLPPISSFGESPIMVYNALGDYARADSLAHVLDSRILGHIALSNTIVFFGLYFHTSATPNFSARLRELGVDVHEFEKKYYTRLPVAKLE